MESTPNFETFAHKWHAGKHQVVWTTLVRDLETPVSAMLKLGQGKPFTFLLESMEGGAVRGRYSIIGREPDLIWRCKNGKAEINRTALTQTDNFVSSASEPIEDLRVLMSECRIDDPNQPQPMAAGLFGYLGYDMVRYMERLPEMAPAEFDAPEAILVRPTLLAIFDQIENKFTLVTPVWFNQQHTAEQAYNIALDCLRRGLQDLNREIPNTSVSTTTPSITETTHSNVTETQFTSMVNRAKEYIRAGDIFQVVLSQRLSLPFTLPPFSLYRAIRRLDPSPFLFFFDLGSLSIIGSSPEILVRVRENKVTIRPIAGTRPRGPSNHKDVELEAELLSDPKELAEHLMLLDLGRNDVGRVAKVGTVKVTEQNSIERYKHVIHIVSNVEGELDHQYSALDALIGGFPAGTVSGAPKIRAMEIIAELEPSRRGVYAGCIGYFGVNGSMDTAIAIRTAVIQNNILYVQAGAGIVHDSDPLSEYNECLAKARGLIRAAEAAFKEQ